MSPKEMESKSTEKESRLEVIKKDDNGNFIVKDRESGNICTIEDTFAEMFPFVATSPAIRNLTSDFYFLQ